MQIGMLDHRQKWFFHLIKMHERLDKYNAICSSVPSCHDLAPKNKSYEVVSQWNGNQMNEMSWYRLAVVTQSLPGRSLTQSPIFNFGIECTQALLEVNMYARYKSYDNAISGYMEDDLHRFHTFKGVFLFGRAGREANANTNPHRRELVQMQKVEDETNAETWTPTKQWRGKNT
jgi:hypothetical protein